jgi:hypothetical protein
MTSRQFQTKALLQAHALVVKDYLSDCPSDDEISLETADWLATNAGYLAKRLTVEWEDSMAWAQENDLRIKEGALDANRTAFNDRSSEALRAD